MLNTTRLGVLREVARQGSFSGAAAVLGYTQPAVSRQVATLEAETGTVLVKRTAQGARVTDAGEVLVRHAETIFAALDDAESELQAIIGLAAGRVRLAAFPSAAASVMPLAIARFRNLHPHIELIVEMLEPEDALPRLRAGELDIAFINHVAAETVVCVHLFDDPMYVALPVGHRLAERPKLRLRDLAFENDDYNALLGFVAAGVGVAMIPDLAVRAGRDDVVIRSLGGGAPIRKVSAAMPAGYRAPAVEAMLEVLLAVGREWEEAGRACVYS